MKTLKKKFSIYQSSQKVRKLWSDYSEARGSTNSGIIINGSNSWSAHGSEAPVEEGAGAPSLPYVPSVVGGQGPARALRAFVDAVDLADGKQAAMLQNLDESGQGELVATLLELAESLVGADARSASLSLLAVDVALAEKALTVVQTCLDGDGSTTPRRPKEWKEHLRQLVPILTGEESAPDGHILVPLDTDMSRRMTEVKAVTLRVLRLVAFDRERVAELGRCGGFQAVSRLALPEDSLLRFEAVETIVHLLVTASPEPDSSRSPVTVTVLPETRGRTGRWGKVGRFGNGGVGAECSRSRLSSDNSGKGAAGEEESVSMEASLESPSSTSSLADAASFVYSSLQALVSSGRDVGGISPPPTLGFTAGGGTGGHSGHLPMPVLPQSLVEEASRIAAFVGQGGTASKISCPDAVACSGCETGVSTGPGRCCSNGMPGRAALAGACAEDDVAELMLVEGVLANLVDVIAPQLAAPEGEEAGRTGACEAEKGLMLHPPLAEGQPGSSAEGSRLGALEAAVLILEGRPRAQAEFARLGGYARVCCFIHDAAKAPQNVLSPPPDASGESSDSSGQGRNTSRADSSHGDGRPSARGPRALDAAFEALFRLALDGHAVVNGARADGVDSVKALLLLAVRSPSLPVALRAASSLQALLRVRPMNAVALERHDALRAIADAVAFLALTDGREGCSSAALPSWSRSTELGISGEEAVAERRKWSFDEKREALASMNDVVRVLAAVYGRHDSRALERYADILLSSSTARFSLCPASGRSLGAQCSRCGATATAAAAMAANVATAGRNVRRCLAEGCDGAAGLCRACDATLHNQADGGSHIRVPVSARKRCEPDHPTPGAPPHRAGPEWAVEAGKALMKAMAIMLDDRESFGLPPSSDAGDGVGQDSAAVDDGAPTPPGGILTVMLNVIQDELLEPLQERQHFRTGIADRCTSSSEEPPVACSPAEGGCAREPGDACQKTRCDRALGWTGGWLLGALEIVARVVVRGDSATVEELGAAGAWGLLAHITRLLSPPRHMYARRSAASSSVDADDIANPSGEENRDGGLSPTSAAGEGRRRRRRRERYEGERLSEVWVGWVGARRLSLWIIREALLTGAGQFRSRDSSAAALAQPARWLVWLVQALMKSDSTNGGDFGPQSESQAADQILMKLAILNELRLAIGSFAPCEVVMEGCTRVLPLVTLSAKGVGSKMAVSERDDAGSTDEEKGGRTGVSPNRHPQARMGAANVKVVGRLAGDQRGAVLDALVSEGMMEVLLSIIQGNASSSANSRTAESSLALLLLADLSAGSERAKARLGSTLGYDTLASAAHGAGVAVNAHHYSLWLEASLRRYRGATARLDPPFLRLNTNPDRAIAVAFTFGTDGSPSQTIPSVYAAASGQGGVGSSRRREEGTNDGSVGEGREYLASRGNSRRRRRGGWTKRGSPQRVRAEGTKEGIAWVSRGLPKLPSARGRGAADQVREEEGRSAHGGKTGGGARGESGSYGSDLGVEASAFDELWLPPGLVTLAQDVLLINRARGGAVARGEKRYFIAQAGRPPNGTANSGFPVWKAASSKFRGLEAAVFPFLLLPLVPPEHQPQAAGQLSRLLDANPANAATLCYLRVPLALLKLACLLPEQSQVRDLYFRLSAQLMSHHMSPEDALELFHLASLQPSAWARLGRLRVTSGTDALLSSEACPQQRHESEDREALEAGEDASNRGKRRGRGNDDRKRRGMAMPPHSGELQMQLLYVIGTVVDSPSPAWFFHMDGSAGSGLVAGPFTRFPPRRTGYSLSMWLRPAGFSARPGGEIALFSLSERRDDGAARAYLRVSLRRCLRAGDKAAPPAAVGIGAREDDDDDHEGSDWDGASAKVVVHALTEEGSESLAASGTGRGTTPTTTAAAASAAASAIATAATATAVVGEPEVRCSRWHQVVVAHSYASDASCDADGRWVDGSISVFVDGERRALATDSPGKSKRGSDLTRGALAYPGAGGVSASVGCWQEEEGGRDPAATPLVDTRPVESATRFSGQMATVAVMEGAWTGEAVKAAFLRGPGVSPPGKRVAFACPGDLRPTPFLDGVDDADRKGRAGSRVGSRAGSHEGSQGLGAKEAEPALEVAGVAARMGQQLVGQGGCAEGEAAGAVAAAGGTVPTVAQGPIANAGPSSLAAPAAPLTRGEGASGQAPSCDEGDPPRLSPSPCGGGSGGAEVKGPPRLSVMLAPVRKAIDRKYGVAVDEPSRTGNSAKVGASGGSGDGLDGVAAPGGGEEDEAGSGVNALSESVALTVSSFAVAAGCGGSKDSASDRGSPFRLAGRGTWVYATTPLHAAVQAAGGFRLCVPFLRMDHARQVAALRVLAGLLEASAEGLDAFRVRDGFNVLYHALAQGDDALQQLSMDTFDTLFDLMTSEALQGAVDVSSSSTLLDSSASGRWTDTAEQSQARGAFLANATVGVKPVRSPEALRLVVDLLGHCEGKPELQARVMEALVDALDGSPAGIQVWRRAFQDPGPFAPLLYLLSPPSFPPSPTSCPPEGVPTRGIDTLAGSSNSVGTRGRSSRRQSSFSMSSGQVGGSRAGREDGGSKKVSTGQRPAVAAGAGARTQAARMLQVLIAGSAAVAAAVRPQDPAAAVATSTSAGCTPDHLAALVGFVLRCHHEVEKLTDIARREMLNTGEEERFGLFGAGPRRGSSSSSAATATGSAQSQLTLTRQVLRTVVELLVQMCGGDGGAVVVGMMSQALPAGGNFLLALDLLSSSHAETRVSAIKLLSLMLVRKGDDGRRSSAPTSTFFSSDESAVGGRSGADPQALRAFEKLGGFTAMCRQLEPHATCQAMCDALMGMIFGVWGSKHEPRPIREKDVLAIKGNKESWLRAWWSSYSNAPDEDTTQPNATGQASTSEGVSLVNRLRSTAAAAAAAATPAATAAAAAAAAATATTDPNPFEDAAASENVTLALDLPNDEEEDTHNHEDAPEKEDGLPAVVDPRERGPDPASSQGEDPNAAAAAEGATGGSSSKTGRFAALIKGVEVSHNGGTPLKPDGGATGTVVTVAVPGQGQGASGMAKATGDKEETGFLSGILRRLSIEPASAGTDALATTGPLVAKLSVPRSPAGGGVAQDTALAGPATPPSTRKGADKPHSEMKFDPLASGSSPEAGLDAAAEEAAERRSSEDAVEDTAGRDGGEGRGGGGGGDGDGGGGDGSGGGGGGGEAEEVRLVLPETVEVLMRALQRAQSPAVLARCLLQLESAVAWLPPAPAPEGQGQGRGGRKDFGGGRTFGGEDDSGGTATRLAGKSAAAAASGSGAAAGGAGRNKGKEQDGGDRERNADALMSRQGWLTWCHRLVDALAARSDNGDLMQQRRTSMGYDYGGNDGDLSGNDRWGTSGSGNDRWGTGGSDGGYLDDSHSETTDTGSAFSYFESSSVGRSVVPGEGPSDALDTFTGPVYGLVAALLEQDMARAPQDKRGHRFLELFSPSVPASFQAAVLEDALDGVQDNPVLSTGSSRTSPTTGEAGGAPGDGGDDGSVQRLESLRELLDAALYHRPDLPLQLCVKSVHTINVLGYHSSHEARSRMKSVGLLGMRDDLIRRCLFHPDSAAWEKVSALSQVEDALETLVSKPGKSSGEAEATAAGEVALKLLQLFVEVTAAAVGQTAAHAAPSGVHLSPVGRSNTAAASAAARATQVAAARALGRVATASSYCRTTVISMAREQQLLVRLLPALRCPLTMEEVEAIELGNIPEALPSLSASSRWSLGSISLLPTSTGPTSCMSDDAEEEQWENQANQSPQRSKAFFPSTPPASAAATGAGSWPPSAPGGSVTSFLSGSKATAGAGIGTSSGGGGGSGGGGVGASSATVATAASMANGHFRLHEVLDEVVEEEDDQGGMGEAVEAGAVAAAAAAAAAAAGAGVAAAAAAGSAAAAGAGSEGLAATGPRSPVSRKRARRRSSSDVSSGNIGGFGSSGGGSTTNVFNRSRPLTSSGGGGGGGGGGSWHDPSSGRLGRGVAVGGGWGVPEHHDLHAFVQWYSGDEQREIREALRHRVSKALEPLDKARKKTATKLVSRRERAARQAQKREAEATSAKEKAATDALERCRAHSEKSADRTTANVDAWLAERRRRWEAGRTRCEELAPPMGAGRAVGAPDDTVGGGANVSAGLGPAFAPDLSAGCYGDTQDAAKAGCASGSGGGGREELDGVFSLKRQSLPPWDWGKGGVNGASFDDFFETFAGGRVEAVGQPPADSASAN